MSTDYRCVGLVSILLLAGGLLTLSGCVGREHTGRVTEPRKSFVDHPALTKLRVDDTFEKVWGPVVEIFEERGYEEIELNQTSHRNTYTTTVSVEDQPRDEQLRETVTEHRGTIVATTADGRLVPLELQEEYGWGMTTLDVLDALGGRERRTLLHEGVEISVSDEDFDTLHTEEIRVVFEQIRNRFGD